MSQNNHTAVEANMYFLSRDEKYREEKPYTLRYSTDDGFPQTNIERTEYSIKFYDMRTETDLAYSRCGFRVAKLQSQMQYEDYDDVKKIESIHQPEVAECVKQAMKASSVEILDYVVSHTYSRFHNLMVSVLTDLTGTAKASNMAHCYRRKL
jgi:hypothetical protein